MVMVASWTAQEPKLITQKPEGGASVSREEIQAEMEPLRINVGDTRWVYHCHVEGCTGGPSTSQVAICSHVHQAHWVLSYCVPSVLKPLALMPSDAMASGCIPLGPWTMSKAYFIYFTPFYIIFYPLCITIVVSLCCIRKVTSVKLHCKGLLKCQAKVFSSAFHNIMLHKDTKVTCVNMFLCGGL